MIKYTQLGFCLFLTLLFISNLDCHGQDEVRVMKSVEEINFDGILDETAWQVSSSFPLVMHFPVYNNVPEEKSEVYITFDDNYFWVGAILYYNDMDNIVSTSKKRDEESDNSDAFGIVLDSYDDNENALGFFTMPTGIKIDYTISNDGQSIGPEMDSRNYAWNTFWDVKTSVTDKSWQVEMRIPFSSLRFQRKNNLITMGLIINRQISHLNEIDTYPAIDTKYGFGANTRPSLAKTIVLEHVKTRNPVYISPYVLGGMNSNNQLNETETGYDQKNDPEITGGLDVKYNLNNNFTLDFTANTDFAQVEADDQMVNLTRYSLFFPEKRLFFQERSGIFSYDLGGPQNLFYSRNIGLSSGEPVRIIGGTRMVGRLGKWDLGILNMNTARFNTNPAENFGVARLRKQVINENSYIGGMVTSRVNFDGKYNVAYGFDGIFRLAGVDYLDVKIAQVQDSEIENNVLSLNPTYFTIGLQRRSEEGLVYECKYAYWGKNFSPGSGFILINNVQKLRGRLGYGWFPGENSSLFNYYLGANFEIINRLEDKQMESINISPEFSIVFKSGYFISTGIKYNKEGLLYDFPISEEVVVTPGEYSYLGFSTMVSSPRTQKLVATGIVEGGEFYDGNRISLSITPEYGISSSVQLSASYQYDKVNFPNRNLGFVNNIARLKAIFMFNTKLSLSSLVQYNQGANIVLTNFRLRYNPRDGNDFYVVLNDMRNADKSELNPISPGYLNRSILVKYTHTFKL